MEGEEIIAHAGDVSTVMTSYVGYLKDKNGTKLYPQDKKQYIMATASELSINTEFAYPTLTLYSNSDANSFTIEGGRIKVLRDMTVEISMQTSLADVGMTTADYIMLFLYVYRNGSRIINFNALTSNANWFDSVYITPVIYDCKAGDTIFFALNNPKKLEYLMRGGIEETRVLVKEV